MMLFSIFFMFNVPVNNFSVMSGWFPVFLGWTSTKQQISVFLKDTTVTLSAISIELATLQSPVWCSSNWATAIHTKNGIKLLLQHECHNKYKA